MLADFGQLEGGGNTQQPKGYAPENACLSPLPALAALTFIHREILWVLCMDVQVVNMAMGF